MRPHSIDTETNDGPQPESATQPQRTRDPNFQVDAGSGKPSFLKSKSSDVFLLVCLTGLTVVKFVTDEKLMALNLFFVVVLGAGYAVGKRYGILMAFLTQLLVWAFILSDPAPFLAHYNEDTLYFHMTLWSGFLILAGWLGGVLAKAIHGTPKPA